MPLAVAQDRGDDAATDLTDALVLSIRNEQIA
jgi:hypothetical protein